MIIFEILTPIMILSSISFSLQKLSEICMKKYYKNTNTDYDGGALILNFLSYVFLIGTFIFTFSIFGSILMHTEAFLVIILILNLTIGLLFAYFFHKKILINLRNITKNSKFDTMFTSFYWQSILHFIFSPLTSVIIFYIFNFCPKISFNNVFSKSLREFKNARD